MSNDKDILRPGPNTYKATCDRLVADSTALVGELLKEREFLRQVQSSLKSMHARLQVQSPGLESLINQLDNIVYNIEQHLKL